MKYLLSFFILIFIISCTPKLQENTHRVSNEGDILQIQYKGAVDSVRFEMFQGLGVDLIKGEDNIFKGELEIPNLENGIFSYEFFIKKDSAGQMILVEYKPKEKNSHFVWIGNNREVNYSKANQLKGTVSIDTISSKNFERAITIYNPPNTSIETPILYFTDANWFVEKYIQYVDQLIADGKIEPIKIIGLHNGLSNRYAEYVFRPDKDSLFRLHEDWLLNTVIPTVEPEIPNWKGKRYIYGVSNSAAFCMYMGLNYPNLFEEIIALSTVAYISEYPFSIEFYHETYPKFYMGAGRYEDWTFKDNVNFIEKMKAQNIDVEFKEYVSSHDYNVWRVEFLDYLMKRFGKKQ